MRRMGYQAETTHYQFLVPRTVARYQVAHRLEGKGMATILIVDDSGFQRTFLSKALAEGDYRVLEATNGAQALEVVTADRPDCILTDLIMPDMRGLVLLETLQQRDSDIPVVVLTADIQDEVEARCLELGAVRVLHKPVKPTRLRETIAEVLAGEADP